MKIGIMGAMPEEVDSIKKLMTEVRASEHGSRRYYSGKINDVDVVLVFSRCGKVAASTTATSLITSFGIHQLIFTGVAGAAASALNIGDIVIAEQLYQHDMDASPLFPKHEIPLTGHTFFKADAMLREKAYLACDHVTTHLSSTVSANALSHFGITVPKAVVGTIGTGDRFIASVDATKAILAERPETLAVEMEGAAVAQVCQDFYIPFVVIRTISDKADHSAYIDFPKFIAEVAAHYSEHIIAHMFSNTLAK